MLFVYIFLLLSGMWGVYGVFGFVVCVFGMFVFVMLLFCCGEMMVVLMLVGVVGGIDCKGVMFVLCV